MAAIDDNTISGIDTVVFGKTLNNTIVDRQVVGYNALGTTARTGDICTSTCNQDSVGFECPLPLEAKTLIVCVPPSTIR